MLNNVENHLSYIFTTHTHFAMVTKTINTTVDSQTHRVWGIVAKKHGLTKIDLLRSLVTQEAVSLGIKLPKFLQEYKGGYL